MKKVSVMVAAILGLALSVGANAQVSKKDQEFLNKAAVGGLYEVEAGRLAQEKANSSDVKAFGEMLVKDHSSANDELKALATSKSAVLPSELPAEKKNRLAKVAEAIARVRPYAVDVSGGVEQAKGIKDAAKIEAFMRAVKQA